MTLAERVQLERSVEQSSHCSAERVYCGCGCGAWWYRPHREGRPRGYLTEEHYRKERNRRRRRRVS